MIPWTAAHQASLSFTISQNLLKLLSLVSVVPSNQASFNFMAAVTVYGDFRAQEKEVRHCFLFFPIYLAWSDGISFFNVFLYAAAAAKSRRLCPTLCDPIDGSPDQASVPGILQARTLEWVAIAFSNVFLYRLLQNIYFKVFIYIFIWKHQLLTCSTQVMWELLLRPWTL